MSLRSPPSLIASLASLRIAIPSAAPARTFTTTSTALARKVKRKAFNPYATAISKKRREANIARQAELRQLRAASAVDPVLGRTTPFLESLHIAPMPLPALDAVLSRVASAPSPEKQRLNHFISPTELPEFFRESREMTKPRAPNSEPYLDPALERDFHERHLRTVEAIRRIIALGNGSTADRTRANKQICIDLFGRHTTDQVLPRDHGAPTPEETGKTPRAGPDTGSSEVQAAILTVKIQALARALHRSDGFNTKDKHNKRNLRLMVHRRQKLLKYLKRKEKGGIRYRNVMEALGLDDDAIERELFL